jgi:hypothetical protein
MKLEIDEELKDCITEEWLGKVLAVVPPKMLENLTLRIIEPHWEPLEATEETIDEVNERFHWAFSPENQVAVLKVRKESWKYYSSKRAVAKTIYHEIFHANDLEDIKLPRNKQVSEEEYLNDPREIRARAFEKKMFRCLKHKRELFSLKEAK